MFPAPDVRHAPESLTPREQEKQVEKAVDVLRAQMRAFSEEHGLRSMNSRWRRGMNAAAILAIGRTRAVVDGMVAQLSPEHAQAAVVDLEDVVSDIQRAGPWKHAARLREAADPAIKMWYLLEFAAVAERAQATERQLTQREFLAEVDETTRTLEQLALDTTAGVDRAIAEVRADARAHLRIEDGIPVTESAHGFIDMAVQGYRAGVFQDADGMLYVGAEHIPDGLFLAWGLERVEEKKKGKTLEHFLSPSGDTLVQKTGPG